MNQTEIRTNFVRACATIDARIGALMVLAFALSEQWALFFLTKGAPKPKDMHTAMLQSSVRYDSTLYATAPAGTRVMLRALELYSRKGRDAVLPALTHMHTLAGDARWEYLIGGGGRRAWATLRLLRDRNVLATVSFAVGEDGAIAEPRIIVETNTHPKARIERSHAELLVAMLHELGLGTYTWQEMVGPDVRERETSRDERAARQQALLAAPPAVVETDGRLTL